MVAAAPWRGHPTLDIDLAPADRNARFPYAVQDGFADDATRREVLRHLLPQGRVALATSKARMPHHRRLDIRLADERRVMILLDQGFGAWRSGVMARHDFAAAPKAQAAAIVALSMSILPAEAQGSPATIEVS